jgi:hypothetical protein
MAAFSKVYNTESIFKHTIIAPPDCKLIGNDTDVHYVGFDFHCFNFATLWYLAVIHYWRNPKLRAERIVEVCSEDPLNFIKNFWLVQEKGTVYKNELLNRCLLCLKLQLDVSFSETLLLCRITKNHIKLSRRPS